MSGTDYEKIETEFQEIEQEFKKTIVDEEPVYNETPTGSKFDLSKIVLELEKIGNQFIENKLHKELKFNESEIELHSEMLSYVLEKNFSIETLKNTPEYVLSAQTALMAIGFWQTLQKLKANGDL